VTMLKRVGFWAAKRPTSEGLCDGSYMLEQIFDAIRCLPTVEEFVDASWDQKERQMVAAYLDQGRVLERYLGHSACRLCDKSENGSADLTDGVYVWPEGFAHYVRQHNVKPPVEFVDHVKKMGLA
jgi:hypothetical protein